MNIYTDIQSKLEAFDKMMDAKLDEIRQIRNEIVQLHTQVQDEHKWGTYLHDDQRIVLSAPEIIIGNVDKQGHLQGGVASKVIVRGNKVNIEGVGDGENNTGMITNQATRIINRASDPGPYGVEDIVYQKSLIANISRAINLRSVSDLGTFYSDFENVPAGINIHSDGLLTVEANQPMEQTMQQLEARMKQYQAHEKQLDTTLKQIKEAMKKLTDKMNPVIERLEEMNEDRENIRNNAVEYSTLSNVLHQLSERYYMLSANYFANQTAKAEKHRQVNALTQVKASLQKDIARASKATSTQAGNITIKSTNVSVDVMDNAGTYHTDAGAGFRLNATDIKLNARELGGKLLADGAVSIGGQTVKIDTNDYDGDFTSGSVTMPGKGTFTLQSKNITIESVDYSLDGNKKKEDALTAGSRMMVRTESIGLMAVGTDGKAVGDITVNAKAVTLSSSDAEKDEQGGFKPSALAAGGSVYIPAEKVAVGGKTAKEVTLAAEKANLVGKSETNLGLGEAGGAPTSAVSIKSDNITIGAKGNTEIYGKTTMHADVTLSYGIKGPSAEFDGVKVSSGFKSPNLTDGMPSPKSGSDSAPAAAAAPMPEETGAAVQAPEGRKVEAKEDETPEISTLIALVEELPEPKEDATNNTDDKAQEETQEKEKSAVEEALTEEQQPEEQQTEEQQTEEEEKQEEEEQADDKEKTGVAGDTDEKSKEDEKAMGDLVERYELFIRIYKEECDRLNVEYGSADDLKELSEQTARYEMMAENVLTISQNIPTAINDALYFIQNGLLIEPYTSNMSGSTREKVEAIRQQLIDLENKRVADMKAVDETLSPSERIKSEMMAGNAANTMEVGENMENILSIVEANAGDSALAGEAVNALFMIVMNNADANAEKAVLGIKDLTLSKGADADAALADLLSIAMLREGAVTECISAICDITLEKNTDKEKSIGFIQNIAGYFTDYVNDANKAIERLGGVMEEEVKDERTPLQKVQDTHNNALDETDPEQIAAMLEFIVAVAMENLEDTEVIKEAYSAFRDLSFYNARANNSQIIDCITTIAMETEEDGENAVVIIRTIAENNPDLINKAVQSLRNISLGPVGTPIRTIYDLYEDAGRNVISPTEAMDAIAKVADENKDDVDVVNEAVTIIGSLAVNNILADAGKAVQLITRMALDTSDSAEEIVGVIEEIFETKPEATIQAIEAFLTIAKANSSLKENITEILRTMDAYNEEGNTKRSEALEELK